MEDLYRRYLEWNKGDGKIPTFTEFKETVNKVLQEKGEERNKRTLEKITKDGTVKAVFVALSTETLPVPHTPSHKDNCATCNREVWIGDNQDPEYVKRSVKIQYDICFKEETGKTPGQAFIEELDLDNKHEQ